jgi:hypothetical protein
MIYEEKLFATMTQVSSGPSFLDVRSNAPRAGQLTYMEQLHVWHLLLKKKLAGKIAPAHPWDRRSTEYALLIPHTIAVAEINAVLDTPITVARLPSILARFRHLDPPYSDATPGDERRSYKREWMRRKRGAERVHKLDLGTTVAAP